MEKRIKIFKNQDVEYLADEINHFLRINSGRLHEVVFKSVGNEHHLTFYTLLIYTPEDGVDSEKETESQEGYGRIQRGGITQRFIPGACC